MKTQLIIMDIVGNALRWMWSASCAAILFFLGAAVFYHGAWAKVAYAAVVAGLLYWLSSRYDGMFISFAAKHAGKVLSRQEKAAPVVYNNASRRRNLNSKLPTNGHSMIRVSASLAEMG